MQETNNANPEKLDEFLRVLRSLPRGHSLGHYSGRRWSATLDEASGGRRFKLFAEELGGNEFVSFNLYLTGDDRLLLKPCEMPAGKVIDFVFAYAPDSPAD